MKKGNKTPAIKKLSPDITTAGEGAFILTVTGNDFVPGAVVRWNGSPRDTLFVSATQLIAAIPASDVASAGTALIDVLTSPTNQLKVAVNKVTQAQDSLLVPVITRLVPSHRPVGGPGFELTVIGENFIQGSRVLWNGEGRVTTYVTQKELRANILASDIEQARLNQVAVSNPPDFLLSPSSSFAGTDMEIRSAATRQPGPVANESIALALGTDLAFVPAVALPPGQTESYLAGTWVSMLNPPIPPPEGFKDPTPLFSVASTEVRFQVPLKSEIEIGEVSVLGISERITPQGPEYKFSLGVAELVKVAPGLFFLDGGSGIALADGEAVRVVGGTPQPPFKIAQCSGSGPCTATPIPMAGSTQVFVTLLGTGFRHHSGLPNSMSAKIHNMTANVLAAGTHGSSVGMDFVNLEIPQALSGAGLVDVELTVDGLKANVVKIHIAA